MRDKPLCCQLIAGFTSDMLIVPVRLVIDKALLVVQQRVDEDETANLLRVPRCVIGRDASAEARPDKVSLPTAGFRADVLYGAADIVKYPRDCQVLLPAFTFTVATDIETRTAAFADFPGGTTRVPRKRIPSRLANSVSAARSGVTDTRQSLSLSHSATLPRSRPATGKASRVVSSLRPGNRTRPGRSRRIPS